jgi:glycosyltransferase involved in cell wall biosynthesis
MTTQRNAAAGSPLCDCESAEEPRIRPVIVAIPAKNEANSIAACLQSVMTEASAYPGRAEIAILANNCSDDTAGIAKAIAAGAPIPIHVSIVTLPPERAHAGHARAMALKLAAGLASQQPGAIIATTDADSRPQPGWLARMNAAFARGADAVAGMVDFDPQERAPRVSPIRALEARYAELLAELRAWADPLDHDPWPNHVWVWGANFAVTREAYALVGGAPEDVPLAEDRAFAQRLRDHDCRIRHALDVRVWTSARTDGRAPGGLADLISIYGRDDAYPCDAELEAALPALIRASARRKLRELRKHPCAQKLAAYSKWLRAPLPVVEESLSDPLFGRSWAHVERASLKLRIKRLFPGQLEGEIGAARRLLAFLGAQDAASPVRLDNCGLWNALIERTGDAA